MPIEIKKSYYYLNLPYSASEEDIQRKEKVLIKIERAKALKNGKSRKNKIEKIIKNANNILGYVGKNGVPAIKEKVFDTPLKSLITQLCVLAGMCIVAFISYVSLV